VTSPAALSPDPAGPGLPAAGAGAAGLRTEYPFVLPRGFVDGAGQVHRSGAMRLATARDELAAHAEPLVRHNPGYLSVYLLAATVTTLGTLPYVDPAVVESLFAADLAFLQDLYHRVNQPAHAEADVTCPHCQTPFLITLPPTP
jgi:hypothetical protein